MPRENVRGYNRTSGPAHTNRGALPYSNPFSLTARNESKVAYDSFALCTSTVSSSLNITGRDARPRSADCEQDGKEVTERKESACRFSARRVPRFFFSLLVYVFFSQGSSTPLRIWEDYNTKLSKKYIDKSSKRIGTKKTISKAWPGLLFF